MNVSAAAQYRRETCTEGERRTREELAALFRVLHDHGMTDIANQVVGARIENAPDTYLLHPYGLFYDEVTASSLVRVDPDGQPVDPDTPRLNDGGQNLAKWIFGARPDVNYFVHGHCEDVMAVGSTKEGLMAFSQPAVYLMHLVGYIDYEFSEDAEFGEKFEDHIRRHDILVTRNHGYYTVGRTAAEAFFRAYYLRQACSVQIRTLSTGLTPHVIDPQEVARFQDAMYGSDDYAYDGSVEWPGLMRRLARNHPDYRD